MMSIATTNCIRKLKDVIESCKCIHNIRINNSKTFGLVKTIRNRDKLS